MPAWWLRRHDVPACLLSALLQEEDSTAALTDTAVSGLDVFS
jgi:hypothetical protein